MNVVIMGIGPGGLTPMYMPVIGGTPAGQTLKELVEFAKKPENWFKDPNDSAEAAKTRSDPRPEAAAHAPHARHIKVKCASGQDLEYHITFTITKGQLAMAKDENHLRECLFRHATIGTGDMTRLVGKMEAFTILKFLGFKTEEPYAVIHPDFPAVVFLEPLPEGEQP